MELLITIYLILFGIIAWKRFDYAMMAIIVCLPSYLIRFNIFGIPFTVLEGMIIFAFFVWLLKHTEFVSYLKNGDRLKRFAENKKKRLPYPFGIEIIFLLIISLVAVGVAGFSNSALGIWKAYFFEPALFFILILNLFSLPDEKQRMNFDKIIYSLAISAFLVSALSIYQKFTGNLIFNPLWQAADTRRVVSFFGYPNAVGLYLGPIVLVLIGWVFNFVSPLVKGGWGDLKSLFKNKTPLRPPYQGGKMLFFLLIILLSLLSIYFAKSEGALIAIAGALVIFGLFTNKYLRILTIVCVLFFGILTATYQPLQKVVIEKSTLNDFSGQVRKLQWKETWKMLKDGHMFFGSGLSNYQKIILPYHQEGFFFNKFNDPNFHARTVFEPEYRKLTWQPLEIYMYPHNILLNFWTELGIFGMLLFVWIILKYFYFGFKNLDLRIKNKNLYYINLGLLCAMITIIIHGLVDVPYFKNDLAIMFWLWVAMISIVNINKQINNSNL